MTREEEHRMKMLSKLLKRGANKNRIQRAVRAHQNATKKPE
jgi:hypothetical protein